VSATFGTVFGGTLFSVEFTSDAYLVRGLPKAFLTSVCAMILFVSLGDSDRSNFSMVDAVNRKPTIILTSEILSNQYNGSSNTFFELAFFVLFGLLCGVLGVLFVQLVEVIIVLLIQHLFNLKAIT
jgi:H+/Cl- antiporter ClcA